MIVTKTYENPYKSQVAFILPLPHGKECIITEDYKSITTVSKPLNPGSTKETSYLGSSANKYSKELSKLTKHTYKSKPCII